MSMRKAFLMLALMLMLIPEAALAASFLKATRRRRDS